MAIDGDTIVVGVESEPGFTGAPRQGAVYIYGRNVGGADNWGLIKRIEDPDGVHDCCDSFGTHVDISGDTIAVGEFWSDRAHIFERNEGGPDNWGRVTVVTPSDRSAQYDQFARVAIDGDTLAVGASSGHTHAGTTASGALYIYERNAGGPNNWGDPGTGVGNEVKKLVPSDVVPQGAVRNPSGDAACGLRGSNSNYIVSIDGDVVVYGACQHFHAGFGTAFVFERDAGRAGNWGETQELIPSDGGDAFGTPAVDGSTIIIGDLSDNILGSDSGRSISSSDPAIRLPRSSSRRSPARSATTAGMSRTSMSRGR